MIYLSWVNFQWTWNGRDDSGQPLPSGIYYVVIKTEKGVKTVKIDFDEIKAC